LAGIKTIRTHHPRIIIFEIDDCLFSLLQKSISFLNQAHFRNAIRMTDAPSKVASFVDPMKRPRTVFFIDLRSFKGEKANLRLRTMVHPTPV
jgi:hypothetical protein